MKLFRVVLCLFVAVAVVACASSSKRPQRAKQLRYEATFPYDAERDPSLDGVWSNAKYGVTVQFDGANFEIYNRVTQYCWPERVPALRTGYLEGMAESSLMSDKSMLRFRAGRGENEWEFRPIAGLPKDCTAEKDRLKVFDIVVDTMRQNYPNFERRGVMWTRTTADLRRSITSIDSDEELLDLITTATADIGDPQLRLHGPGFEWTGKGSQSRQFDMLKVAFDRQDVIGDFTEYQRRWYSAIQAQIPGSLIEGAATNRIDGNLIYGRMPGNIGYIYIADSSRASHDVWMAELETALGSLASASALILDVSMADAGSLRVMTDLAGRFVPKKEPLHLGKINRLADERWGVAASSSGQAFRGKQVFVVATNHTSGAAEMLPLILRGRSGVRLVGETTRGALTQPLQQSLPNGWVMDIPMVMVADVRENVYDGIGINPDFALELFSESQLTDAHWQAVQTLAALIREGHFSAPSS